MTDPQHARRQDMPGGNPADDAPAPPAEAAPGTPAAPDGTAAAGPATHQIVRRGGKTYHLLGTAHISSRSVEEARELIEQVRPDTVCVELDEARHKAVMSEEAFRELDLLQVVRRKQATMLLAHLVLSAFQRRLGEQLGVQPGQEMVQAIHSAHDVGAEVVLADRDIRVTLRRTWARLGFFDKLRLGAQLMGTLVLHPSISEDEIEALKETDMLTQVMESFAKAFPRAKESLIDERDTYLADRILDAPGETIVAVVGAGHLAGIRAHLEHAQGATDLAPLMELPPRSRFWRGVQWGIPALVIGLLVYGFFQAGTGVSLQMVAIWVLANGVLAALGCALALAHPLTVASAFVAAPLTSLNPMVAAGWVAGLVEVMLRRPRVKDFEHLASDITTLRGFWRNGITRILLVVALANLGSTVGTLVGIPLMTRLLA